MITQLRLRRLLPVVLLAVLPACATDAVTAPEDDQTFGNYALASVGGVTLPVTVYQDDEERWEVVSGALVLRSDGSFSESIAFLITYPSPGLGPRTVPQVDAGSFTISRETVTFTSTRAESWTGTLRNRVVSYAVGGGIMLAFEK